MTTIQINTFDPEIDGFFDFSCSQSDGDEQLDFWSDTTSYASGVVYVDDSLDPEVEHAALYESMELTRPAGIRLLQFDEVVDDGLLHCRLVTMSLELDPAPYVALSYAWGTIIPDGAHLTETILCNGHSIRVTSTIRAALRRISQLSESQPVWELSCVTALWIDAICINQRSLAERGQQVGLMSEIYSRARSVLVWLGEFNSSSQAAAFHPASCTCKHCTALIDSREKESLILDISQDLAPKPWFKRRWIIQECFLAQDIHHLIGSHLQRAWNVCEKFCIAKEPKPPVLRRNKGVYRRTEDLRTLLDNLNHYSGALCSEHSDVVYAPLGIS